MGCYPAVRPGASRSGQSRTLGDSPSYAGFKTCAGWQWVAERETILPQKAGWTANTVPDGGRTAQNCEIQARTDDQVVRDLGCSLYLIIDRHASHGRRNVSAT